MRFIEKTGVVVLRGVLKFFSLFPVGFHYFWADVLAWFLESVIGYRKEVVYINLGRAFPDKKPWEIESIGHDFYVHLAEIIVESVWFSGSSLKRLRKSHIVEMKNVEMVARLYDETPSVTVLYTHCGNWELLGGFSQYNYNDSAFNPFTSDRLFLVYLHLKSKVWDEVFALNRKNPEPYFTGYVEASNILRTCLKNKDSRKLYCYNADQYPYVARHPVGMFLNQPTVGMAGSVAVAHKLGHSVVYMNMVRRSRRRYEMEFKLICKDASKESTDSMLRKYFDYLEEDINAQPANWLWSHKRWK